MLALSVIYGARGEWFGNINNGAIREVFIGKNSGLLKLLYINKVAVGATRELFIGKNSFIETNCQSNAAKPTKCSFDRKKGTNYLFSIRTF